jgi:uncharacterized protein YbjT (DUF2867 family)
MKVLVTGATGNVGSRVVSELISRGTHVRALVRDAVRANARLNYAAERVIGDFSDPPSLTQALAGVDAAFILTPNHPQQFELEKNVIDAVAASGVRRVVKFSSIGAEPGAPLEFWDVQGRLQDYVRQAIPSATIVRSNFHMSALLWAAEQVKTSGQIFAPAAGARIAMIDPRDVAEAAAVVLTTGAHECETLTFSGPQAVTYEQIADTLTRVIGKPVAFIPVPDDAAHAAMVGNGLPEWLAGNLVTLYRLLRGGAGAEVTDAFQRVVGRQPRSFAQWAADHAPAFVIPSGARA